MFDITEIWERSQFSSLSFIRNKPTYAILLSRKEGFFMTILAFILTFIVMIEHIYIMILEMFFSNTNLAAKTFGVEKELLANRKVQTLFANQGLYNGFLAAGLAWGLFFAGDTFAGSLQVFFLSCVVIAALFGGATSSRGILVKQGAPAVLALIVVLLV